MHESAKDVVELVYRANYLLERARCSNEQQEERLEEGMEELSLCLPGLDQGLAVQPTLSPRNKELQKPSRRGEYWTFAIFNPLQYITTNNVPWESPVVSLGGDQGYRACLQMYVSNKESWQGGTLGVGLRLKPGPYDAWLPWPFPGKGVKVAMFRINGKQPYVISFSIPKLGRYGIREAKCSHFLSIQNLWMTQTSWTRNPVLMGKTTSCSSVSPYKEKRRFSLRQRVSLSRESSSWSNRCRKWNQLSTTCTTRTDGWLSKFPDLAHIDTEIIIVVKDVDHALIV